MIPVLDQEVRLSNLEAEQSLLGALLHSNHLIERVLEFLKPEHFADPVHGRMYQKILHFFQEGKVADLITLKPFFENEESLKPLGGTRYAAELLAGAVSLINVQTYGRVIFDFYQRRVLKEELLECFSAIVSPERTASELIEWLEAKLTAIAADQTTGRETADAYACALEAMKIVDKAQKGEQAGVPSGLTELDQRLGGFQPGELYILAGRPGMGKTALALTFAINAARRDHKVLFFSLEMSQAALGQRILARSSGVSVQEQRIAIANDRFERIAQAPANVRSLPLFIDDTSTLTINQIKARATRLKRKKGIQLIIVDYIGLIQPLDKKAHKVHQIEEITTGLKKSAKDLSVPVLALCQLSRNAEHRDDKRPTLSDLRDSGSIEQDADVVMFCYRDAYYAEQKVPKRENFPLGQDGKAKYQKAYNEWAEAHTRSKNTLEIITAKYRQGVTGTDTFYFDGVRQEIKDLARGAIT